MDYQAVLNEVESWPVDDRIRLVQEVWDRLGDQGHEPELRGLSGNPRSP
jgi:hypothetical protein